MTDPGVGTEAHRLLTKLYDDPASIAKSRHLVRVVDFIKEHGRYGEERP